MNHLHVAELFEENFVKYGELGASLSVWHDGREVLSLAHGFIDREKTQPWTVATPVLFWSATKGPAAACVLHACEAYGIPLTARVAEIWPEFAAAGKETITLAQLLSHQAGLAGLSKEVSVLDYDALIAALAEETPLWAPGAGHGYHPRTFGFLLDELVRRITGGTPLGNYWRREFAEPLGLDLWIGLDPAQVEDVAPIFAPRTTPPKGDPFYTAFLTPGSFTARAFSSPKGLHNAAAMNSAQARTSSFPAFGGIGTASSLAKFYAMLACGGSLDGRTFFSTIDSMTTTFIQGFDRVLQMENAFSAGFMRDPLGLDGEKLRETFGPSLSAFGHPGAGGSHAFADPEHRTSFAYVMNQMEPGVLPNAKSLRLVKALYG
ncbi:MAG: hypothetical protein JWL59_3989 [Chthoniobacteraceae bacterium]|nr:hypothetical protein [Chthoniobacteraceae bacterium]